MAGQSRLAGLLHVFVPGAFEADLIGFVVLLESVFLFDAVFEVVEVLDEGFAIAGDEGFDQGLDDGVVVRLQEGLLVAYRTYESTPGIDPLVDREKSTIGHVVYKDGRPYRGSPVGIWHIDSHFDRQRQYNAATGEQTNILEENTTDRPW